MGKKSVRENKTIYQISREGCGLTREKAAEKMEYVSADRIEKIEYEKSDPHPDEVLAMSKAYNNPSLCNHYCSHDCPIGQQEVPAIELKSLAQIVLTMLASFNEMEKERNRLIEITADEKITEEERKDFEKIQAQLSELSMAIESMKLWVKHALVNGEYALDINSTD